MPHKQPAGSESPCPYRVLSDVGIGPQSSMKEVRDSSYLFMQEDRWTPEVRAAWNELRMVEHRLLADFLRGDMDAQVPCAEGAIFDALVRRRGADDVEYDR